jgi:hypothetical protein
LADNDVWMRLATMEDGTEYFVTLMICLLYRRNQQKL